MWGERKRKRRRGAGPRDRGRRAGGNSSDSSFREAPPVASSYLLTIMVPEFRTKLGIRQLRELKTLCRALDLVVEGEARRAADILAQRAVEAALHDD